MKHFDAVIFDMDGTLLDTERVAQEAFLAACGELGVAPRRDLLLRCVGGGGADCPPVIQEGYGPGLDGEAFFPAWNRHFNQLSRMTPAPLKEGALALLDAVAELGLPMAIATSSRTEHALDKLHQAGLLNRFQDRHRCRSGAHAQTGSGGISEGGRIPGASTPVPVWRLRIPSTVCARPTPPA